MSGVKHTPVLIYDDPRPIDAIWFNSDPEGGGWSTSIRGYDCSRIVAYREHGQGDYVPYLAVYSGDDIIARVPVSAVSIHYARARGEQDGGGE